jgi:hypothetical protein
MLRRLHQRHARGPKRPRWQQGGGAGRALVILPYISVVAEKAAHLSGLVRGLRWVVRGYMGASQGTPLSKRVSSGGRASRDWGREGSRYSSQHCRVQPGQQQQEGMTTAAAVEVPAAVANACQYVMSIQAALEVD